jgi:hypothetical protein
MDITGDGKLLKEVLIQGSGDTPLKGNKVEGMLVILKE